MMKQTDRAAAQNTGQDKHYYAWAFAVVALCIGGGAGLLSSMLWLDLPPFVAGSLSMLAGKLIIAGIVFAVAVLTLAKKD